MSNELAAVVTTYEVELVRADRMSRNDGPLDERKASDRSQGLQTTSRPEPGSCPTGEHQALHDGTAQRQWRARAIQRSWDCIQSLSDATGDLQAASPAVLLGPAILPGGDPGERPRCEGRPSHPSFPQCASVKPAPGARRVRKLNPAANQAESDGMTGLGESNAIRLAERRRLARMTSLMAKIRKWLGMGKKA